MTKDFHLVVIGKLQNKTYPVSANLEQHDDRLLVLRVGAELKKSELDAVQAEFVKTIAGAGTVKLLVLLENFTGWGHGTDWGDTDFFFSHRNEFEKIAVGGDPRWDAQVLAFSGAGLRKGPGKFEQPRVRLFAAAFGVALFAFAVIRMLLMPAA